VSDGSARLAAALREEGGLLAAALRADPPADEPLLRRPPGDPYALTLAAVREGYLLHYAGGRVLDADDGDLALLGGDRLYALGLAQLAELGELEAVAQLADLISRCAQAHAEDDPSRAAAAWKATAAAIGRCA
jgi:hypothetical protein